jgi:hypothetical protein
LGPGGEVPRSHADLFDLKDFQGIYVGVSSGAEDQVAVWRFNADGAGSGSFLVSPHPGSTGAAAFSYIVSPQGEVIINAPVVDLFARAHFAANQRQLHGVVASQFAWGSGDLKARTLVLVKQ